MYFSGLEIYFQDLFVSCQILFYIHSIQGRRPGRSVFVKDNLCEGASGCQQRADMRYQETPGRKTESQSQKRKLQAYFSIRRNLKMNKTMTSYSQTGRDQTLRLVKMGSLVAVSIVLVYLIHFPLFPAVSFLEYDPADIPILIGTFTFGPAAGLALTLVTSVIQGVTVSAGSGLYGILMHLIATGTLVVAAGTIYHRKKTKTFAVIGLAAGTAAMAAVMVGANLIITPLFMGVTREVVWDLMAFIIGFNVIKAGINGLVTFILYKRISNFLKRN